MCDSWDGLLSFGCFAFLIFGLLGIVIQTVLIV